MKLREKRYIEDVSKSQKMTEDVAKTDNSYISKINIVDKADSKTNKIYESSNKYDC